MVMMMIESKSDGREVKWVVMVVVGEFLEWRRLVREFESDDDLPWLCKKVPSGDDELV